MASKPKNGITSRMQEEAASLGVLLLLQMLGETRVQLGLDADASEVFDRALRISGAFGAIGLAAPESTRLLRGQLVAAEPVIARLAELGDVTRRTP